MQQLLLFQNNENNNKPRIQLWIKFQFAKFCMERRRKDSRAYISILIDLFFYPDENQAFIEKNERTQKELTENHSLKKGADTMTKDLTREKMTLIQKKN